MARAYRRIGVAIAIAITAVLVGAKILSIILRVGVDQIFPVVVLPGEEVHLWVRNLRGPAAPRVSFAGSQLEVIRVQPFKSSTSIVVVRAPAAIGSAPLKVSQKRRQLLGWLSWVLETGTSDQELTVVRANTIQYPSDGLYLLRNPGNLRDITPFGPHNVLVVAGVPTDVVPRFTLGDLDAAVQNQYSVVSSYYSAISKNSVALTATLHPQIIPLTKKYGEFIRESRWPVAKGSPVTYPVDLSGYTDRNLSIEVTGPDNVVHVSTSSLDDWSPAFLANVQWLNAWQILFNFDETVYPYFVDHGAGNISVELLPLGAGMTSADPEYFSGSGYRITALRGAAWASFGLAPGQFQLIDGSGDAWPAPGRGGDLPGAAWWSELQTAIDAAGVDLSQFSSVNYMLIGSPVTSGFPNPWALNTIGNSEYHSLRASATISWGWMRLPHDADWKVWAHETGHNLSLTDEYQGSLDQPGAFINGWSLMAHHFYGSHVTGWEKGPRVGQSSTGGSWLPAGSLLQSTPPGPSGTVATTTVVLAPHYEPLPLFPGDPDPVGYVAEVKLSPSHSIMLEGRQDQPAATPQRFDEELDGVDTQAGNGGVLIYDVRNVASAPDWPNVFRREIVLLSPGDDALDLASPSYSDPATGVTATVLEELGTGSTRAFRVAIDWGRADPPGGAQFDAQITPWNPPPWQTPDIWVDSPLNSYDTYDATTFTPAGDPDGAGDVVAVGEDNRLYARVRNLGPEEIPDATVTFWVATPAGIGDRGDWQRLDPVTTGPIPAGGSTKVYTSWIPSGSGHTCVKVEIAPIAGEVSFTNNMAQENFSNFELATSSPYEPLSFAFDVFNATDTSQQIALRAQRRIPHIEVRLDHAFPVIPARGKVRVTGTLKLNDIVSPGPKSDTPLSITAFAPWHDSEIELGGITLNLQPRRRTNIDVTIQPTPGGLVATGTVAGGTLPRLVTVAVLGADSSRTYVPTRTDARGRFSARIPVKAKGTVSVYAFARAAGDHGSARSRTMRAEQ